MVRQIRNGDNKRVLSVSKTSRSYNSGPQGRLIQSRPAKISEGGPFTHEVYEEWAYSTQQAPAESREAQLLESASAFSETEVRTLIEQGRPSNRINLTITGDGYTSTEKERFFSDAERIREELFTGDTFASFKPLFNVYAVFVASKDSGITDGSLKKSTAFGLYRAPAGSKRAILPGNEEAIEAALKLAPVQADYPIVLANDEFYGGLGGTYAITTRSVESGIIVLRHELGHNFGNVGEEYDSGSVYVGANFSDTLENATWKPWLTQNRTYENLFLSGAYVWKPLSQGPFRADFEFPEPSQKGAWTFSIHVSSVGWSGPDEVEIKLDGQPLNYSGRFTKDRSFFEVHADRSLAPGKHVLEIAETKADGDNVLAFAELYAHESDYNFAPGVVAAFPVFNEEGIKVGYRPTHTDCIMRNMLSTHFCAADQENFWVRFLDRLSLIDQLDIQGNTDPVVELKTLQLTGLSVRWFTLENGTEKELSELAGLSRWTPKIGTRGNFRVRVSYKTPEVKTYTGRFESQRDFTL